MSWVGLGACERVFKVRALKILWMCRVCEGVGNVSWSLGEQDSAQGEASPSPFKSFRFVDKVLAFVLLLAKFIGSSINIAVCLLFSNRYACDSANYFWKIHPS